MRKNVVTAIALCSLAVAALGCGSSTEEGSLTPAGEAPTETTEPGSTDPGPNDAGVAPRDSGTARDAATGRDASAPTPTRDAGPTVTPSTDAGPTTNPGTNVTPSAGNTAAGVTINEVAIFQGVKVSLARDGAAVASTTRLAPVVPGRPGLVRVYVTPTGGARTLRAELTVTTGNTTFTRADQKTVSAASTDAAFASTFNFDLAGAEIAADTRWSVKIYDTAASPAAGDRAGSLFPAAGDQQLGALTGTDRIRIVYVPVKYMADGSGRLPDTSPASIQRIQNAFLKQYPVARVEISVRDPFTWNSAISSNGTGFSQILQAGIQLRAQDNAPRDVYYYLAFNPAATNVAFCQRGCVAGLSGLLTNPNDFTQRASVGLGYAGSEGTAVHELGHAHGRPHSQGCGADSFDPQFPTSYVRSNPQFGAVATIGSWGWDILGRVLLNPANTFDFMGYCDPTFVSDYTYGKLFARIRAANGQAAEQRNASTLPTRYRFVDVQPDGSLAWGRSVELDSEPESGLTSVSFDHADGTVETVRGHYYPYGELNGGYMLVPEPKASVARLRILDRIGQVQSVLGRL